MRCPQDRALSYLVLSSERERDRVRERDSAEIVSLEKFTILIINES